MATDRGDPRILSRPFDVKWAGWATDTLKLQQSGWRLAVNFEPYTQRYQLLIKNEALKLCGISNIVGFESDIHRILMDTRVRPVFYIERVAPNIMVYQTHLELLPPTRFQEIDARPQIAESRIISIWDLNVFATKQTSQVLVDKADMTVIEHLEAIKRLQTPAQQELRKKALSSETAGKELPKIHLVAQLVSYAA